MALFCYELAAGDELMMLFLCIVAIRQSRHVSSLTSVFNSGKDMMLPFFRVSIRDHTRPSLSRVRVGQIDPASLDDPLDAFRLYFALSFLRHGCYSECHVDS